MKQLVYAALISAFTLYGTDTTLLIGPKTNLQQSLITRLSRAQRRIWVASYLLMSAPLVLSLCAAQARGCHVHILVDASQMNSMRGRQVIAQLRKQGVASIIYAAPQHQHLMHHKYAVIDEQVWSGSMNWTTAGSRRNHESVIWTQKVEMVRAFGAHFTTLKRRAARIKTTTLPACGVFFIPDHRRTLKKQLLTAIQAARKHIMIGMYDLQEKTVIRTLIDARTRGVRVIILTDESTPPVRGLTAHCYPHFHHKYAIIDDTVFLGSMNWTRRGMNYNQEAVMVIEQPALRQALQAHTLSLLRASGQQGHAVHVQTESQRCQESRQ